MGKERQSNFELLKIISMLGVIVLHYNHPTIGGAFQYVSFYSTKGMVLYFLECAFVSAVNVFMLISGYFMGGSKSIGLAKPLRLLTQVALFRLVEYLLKVVFQAMPLTAGGVLSQLLPASYFAVLYVAVYLVSPFVNHLMSRLNTRGLKTLMITAVSLISVWPFLVDFIEAASKTSFTGLSTIGVEGSQQGYTFLNFLLMYMIGAFLRITNLNWKPWLAATVLLACWTVDYLFLRWLVNNGIKSSLVLEYCNPLVVLSAVSQFLLFKNWKLKSSKAINSFSKAAFSVYLLNSVLLVLFVDTEKATSGSGLMLLIHLAATCVAICFVCWVAQILFDWITAPLYRWIDQRTKAIIHIENCLQNDAQS